jgi:hypothetical protein
MNSYGVSTAASALAQRVCSQTQSLMIRDRDGVSMRRKAVLVATVALAFFDTSQAQAERSCSPHPTLPAFSLNHRRMRFIPLGEAMLL